MCTMFNILGLARSAPQNRHGDGLEHFFEHMLVGGHRLPCEARHAADSGLREGFALLLQQAARGAHLGLGGLVAHVVGAGGGEALPLDEPFGALDPGIRADMQLLIQRIWRETGVTVFMITHDLSEGFKLGTRLLVFDRPRHDPQAPQAFGATITYDIPLRNRRAGDLPPDLAERIAAREPTREESTP